jgi:hypothetical protein
VYAKPNDVGLALLDIMWGSYARSLFDISIYPSHYDPILLLSTPVPVPARSYPYLTVSPVYNLRHIYLIPGRIVCGSYFSSGFSPVPSSPHLLASKVMTRPKYNRDSAMPPSSRHLIRCVGRGPLGAALDGANNRHCQPLRVRAYY